MPPRRYFEPIASLDDARCGGALDPAAQVLRACPAGGRSGCGLVRLLCRDGGWPRGVSAVSVARNRVLGEGVRHEVEQLAGGAEAGGAAQVEVVVDRAVGGLGVAAPADQAVVVGVAD